MTRYLFYGEALLINAEVLGGKPKVRDETLLNSALSRPATTAFGTDAYPTLHSKAAALLHALCRNHPFVDGNKRTATTATLFFLQKNGYRASWDAAEALHFIVKTSQGQHDVPAITDWLMQNTEAIDGKSDD